MTPEEVKAMYGSAARDYGRPEKNTMVMRVFQPNKETSLKSGFSATRSINGLTNFDIQLPSDAAANARRDWPLAILKDGATATQVGAVIIDQNGCATAKFSRSKTGQESRRAFETGRAALSIAYLNGMQGRKPAAFSLRAVSDGTSKKETDMSDAKEMVALGRAHNMTESAALAIAAGKNLEQFRGEVLDAITTSPINTPAIHNGDTRAYSLGNAIRGQITGKLDGYEAEMHQELSRSMPVTPRGVVVPNLLLNQRASMTTSNISNLTQSTPRGDLFIDALQPASAVMAANATTISGLEKSITVPRETGDATAAFTAEGSAVSESSLTFDSISLTAKRISATSSYTMEALMQSDPNIDQLIRNSQARKVGQVLDDNAMGGSGSGANPRGILNTTGISTVSTGDTTMTRTEALSALSQLESNDVSSAGATFLIDPADYAIIAATVVDSGSGVFVIEGNQILGRNVIQSSLVGNGVVILGDFSHLLIGLFGSTDLIVDPYSSASSAIVRITTHTFADVAVRQPKAFCKITLG